MRKNTTRFPPNVHYGDIVRGPPVKENSCDGVYCSHVLEHFALDDCRRALVNTYRIMKSGGVFRVVLPDLEQCINNYAAIGENPSRARQFMDHTGLGQLERPKHLYSLLVESLGNSRHRWM